MRESSFKPCSGKMASDSENIKQAAEQLLFAKQAPVEAVKHDMSDFSPPVENAPFLRPVFAMGTAVAEEAPSNEDWPPSPNMAMTYSPIPQVKAWPLTKTATALIALFLTLTIVPLWVYFTRNPGEGQFYLSIGATLLLADAAILVCDKPKAGESPDFRGFISARDVW